MKSASLVVAISATLFLAACEDSTPGAVCGDGVVESIEACDDGNLTDGDGCDGACGRESGWDCSAGSICVAICGDGLVVGPEVCDDGNSDSGDGCAANCMSDETCGNGYVDSSTGEACDDGNGVGGDGCSADCLSDETCGNLYVDVAAGEECDEGADNGVSPNHCTSDCLVTVCGDAHFGGDEECDEGEANGEDNGVYPMVCTADCIHVNNTCGDGYVGGDEVCDDGNNDDGDDCRSDCGQNLTLCGNGIVDPGEACDDGNTLGGDGCEPHCLLTPTLLVGAPLCPTGFKIDATHIYFANACSDEVMTVPKVGGVVTTLATGQLYLGKMALDATHVYWNAQPGGVASLMKLSKSGGSPITLAALPNEPIYGMAVSSTYVYMPHHWDLLQVPIGGGSCESLPDTVGAHCVVLDATHVYFAADDGDMISPLETGSYRMPLGGGSIQHLISSPGPHGIGGCAMDESHLYFSNSSGSFGPADHYLRRVPKDGGAYTDLVVWNGWSAAVGGIALDDTHFYWTTGTGVIRKMAKVGGTPITLASGMPRPYYIAVDATHVYWLNWDTSEIMKLPK